jgi:hypothetical protein
MDIKEQAHKYLIDKGCLSVGQTYTAFQVERMLTEFAQEQVKLFFQPAVISSVCSCDNVHGEIETKTNYCWYCLKKIKEQTDL